MIQIGYIHEVLGTVSLVNTKMVIEGPKKERITRLIEVYREQSGLSDTEIYNSLTETFRGRMWAKDMQEN